MFTSYVYLFASQRLLGVNLGANRVNWILVVNLCDRGYYGCLKGCFVYDIRHACQEVHVLCSCTSHALFILLFVLLHIAAFLHGNVMRSWIRSVY